MKQQFWILNSSLLCMLILAIFASYVLYQPIPIFKKTKGLEPTDDPSMRRSKPPIQLDFFNQNDIFGTTASIIYAAPIKPTLVPEIPALHIPRIPTPPEPPKTEFIPPLALTLNGIVVGADELLSIAIMVDEAGKEGIYHVGDKIKDGTIVRITRNRVSIFRANGQEETFYLRKENIIPPGTTQESRWTYVAKKIEDQEDAFELDPHEFARHIESLGELIDMLGIVPVFKAGKPIGIRINKANPTEIAPTLGLEKGDIIESINDISTNTTEDRLKLYNTVINLKNNEQLKITLKRNNKPMVLTYTIGRISRFSRYGFLKKEAAQKDTVPEGLPDSFKRTPLQEHNEQQKDFNVRHKQSNDDTIAQIRQRLLNNMNMRAPNARIR